MVRLRPVAVHAVNHVGCRVREGAKTFLARLHLRFDLPPLQIVGGLAREQIGDAKFARAGRMRRRKVDFDDAEQLVLAADRRCPLRCRDVRGTTGRAHGGVDETRFALDVRHHHALAVPPCFRQTVRRFAQREGPRCGRLSRPTADRGGFEPLGLAIDELQRAAFCARQFDGRFEQRVETFAEVVGHARERHADFVEPRHDMTIGIDDFPGVGHGEGRAKAMP